MTPKDIYQYDNAKKIVLKGFTFISIVAGIVILYQFLDAAFKNYSYPDCFDKNPFEDDFALFGTIGDFIGGTLGTLFSLCGIFLLYLTLQEQRDSSKKESFENRFFELLKVHRENVSEINFSYYEYEVSSELARVTATSRKVFKLIFSQFKEAYEELDFIFHSKNINDIYEDEYLSQVIRGYNTSEIDFLIATAKVDILYLIVFFGLSKDDKKNIATILEGKYKYNFINEVIDIASLKPKKESVYWHEWKKDNESPNRKNIFLKNIKELQKKPDYIASSTSIILGLSSNSHKFRPYYLNKYIKYYGGHQFRLGHYFRHLYQTIKYIDNQVHIKYNEKYEYVKTIRAQLSNYEQAIFFLNSISQLGKKWEFNNRLTHDPNVNLNLITKYQLIKNLPSKTVSETIKVERYYPDIRFEILNQNEQNEKRRHLESLYH